MIAHRLLARIASFAFVVLLMASMPSLAQGVDGAMPEANAASAALAEDAERDAVTAERVRRALGAVPGLQRVLVQVEAGVVTLRGRAPDAEAIERAATLAGMIEGVLTVDNRIEEVTDLSERIGTFAERSEDRFWRAVAFVPLMLAALAVFVLVVLVGRWLSGRRWPFERVAPNAFIATLIRQVVLIASVVVGLVLALDVLNATALLSTVLGAAGIVGLALGFAVRDTVENYVASILLSVRQPFRPDDFVSIDDHQGSVAKLTSRATVLHTPEGNHLRIPNAVVYKAVIVNFTLNPQRRLDFALGIDPDADMAQALEIGTRTLSGLPFALDEPAPLAWIDSLGDWSTLVRFAAWIDQRETDFLRARGESIRQVKLALEDAGIELPGPTYTVEMAARTMDASTARDRRERTESPREDREVRDVAPVPGTDGRAVAGESHEDDLLDESAPREI